jgi:hypothetical protein
MEAQFFFAMPAVLKIPHRQIFSPMSITLLVNIDSYSATPDTVPRSGNRRAARSRQMVLDSAAYLKST